MPKALLKIASTGFEQGADERLIGFSITKMDGDKVLKTLDVDINPGREYNQSQKTRQLNATRNAYLHRQKPFIDEVDGFLDFLADCDEVWMWAPHYVKGVINRELAKVIEYYQGKHDQAERQLQALHDGDKGQVKLQAMMDEASEQVDKYTNAFNDMTRKSLVAKAKKLVPGLVNYKMATVCEHFGLTDSAIHGPSKVSFSGAHENGDALRQVYLKLREIEQQQQHRAQQAAKALLQMKQKQADEAYYKAHIDALPEEDACLCGVSPT